MAKPAATLSATFTFVSQESAYHNVVGVPGDVGQVIEQPGSSASFDFSLANADSKYAYLVNDPMQNLSQVQYYTDINNNGAIDGGDKLVLSGNPADVTFKDLLIAAVENHTTHFVALFDDSYDGKPDTDFNDIIVGVDLSGSTDKHSNAGRGNGSEIGVVNGQLVELDPGNSASHNHGGDFLLL